MRILYLYSELMGYQLPVFRSLVNEYGAEIKVIHWDENRITSYEPPPVDGVEFYKRSAFTKSALVEFVDEFKPSLVYVSGWMDRGYLVLASYLKGLGVPVVAGSDTQWKGNFKQRLRCISFSLLLRKSFTHIWVAGPRQFEYAKRLGFSNDEIIFNSLSADTEKFRLALPSLESKKADYPKRFLYVGAFRAIKGVDILASAYSKYRDQGGDWTLTCVGNGELEGLLRSDSRIEVKGFSSQHELIQLSELAGALVLPSRFDQWGVVVHEFVSAGLPLILSENVGAKAFFLINGYNGITVSPDSVSSLVDGLHRMSALRASDLVKMGQNGSVLGLRVNPDIVAASFVSVISKK